MYEPNTILKLKEPQYIDADGRKQPLEDYKPKNKDDKPTEFPYNRVRTLGASPVSHPAATGWQGVEAQGVIVRPEAAFGGVLDLPLGQVQSLYEVEALPPEEEEPDPQIQRVKRLKSQPTPEEAFKAAEPPGSKKSPTRVRTPLEDLADLTPKPETSPLDGLGS